MSHHCQATLITCEDFRLHQRTDGRNYIGDLIKRLGVDCDLITRGGGIQDLVRPVAGFNDSLLRDLRVSVALHNCFDICLINHADCGAYSALAFKNEEEEFIQHKKDLLAAKEIIDKEFPGKKIKIYFAKLLEGESSAFVIEEIV